MILVKQTFPKGEGLGEISILGIIQRGPGGTKDLRYRRKGTRTRRDTRLGTELFRLIFCFPNTDHVKTPGRVSSFKIGNFHTRTQSFKRRRHRVKPPKYRHRICTGKTKSTRERGLMEGESSNTSKMSYHKHIRKIPLSVQHKSTKTQGIPGSTVRTACGRICVQL